MAELSISESTLDQLEELTKDENYIVLTGRNGSGKSKMLAGLYNRLRSNHKIDYISVDRFTKVTGVLTGGSFPDRTSLDFFSASIEDPLVNSETIDNRLKALGIDGMKKLKDFLNEINFKNIDYKNINDNPMLDYICIDATTGQNIRTLSTGEKCLIHIITYLIDDSYDMLVIDEPELSLEPTFQKKLYKLFTERKDKKIIVATHSHLFLNKKTPTSNFIIERSIENSDEIEGRQIADSEGLSQTTYNLLGNSVEDLFFPTNFVVVEGGFDTGIFKLVWQVYKSVHQIGGKVLVFQAAGGKNKTSSTVSYINDLLKPIYSSSPYRNKVVAFFDQITDMEKREIEKSLSGVECVYLDKKDLSQIFPDNFLIGEEINLKKIMSEQKSGTQEYKEVSEKLTESLASRQAFKERHLAEPWLKPIVDTIQIALERAG